MKCFEDFLEDLVGAAPLVFHIDGLLRSDSDQQENLLKVFC